MELAAERARPALDGLHQLLAQDRPLDPEGWMRVTEHLDASAEETDRVSWANQLGRLLAD